MTGRVVLVTGGGRGLGEAVATLARSRGAAGLVLVDRAPGRAESVAGRLSDDRCRAIAITADIGDAAECARVIDETDAAFGVVHGVVNAAAVTDRGTVWDTTVELWDRMMDVNVRAPFLLMQGAARIMVREGIAGSMVSIGSMTGHGGQVTLTPYAISKGALLTMTKNLANSLVNDRIRVNQLNLGWMLTPTEHEIQKRYHDAPDDWAEQAGARLPWGRLIDPAEVARVLCFLLSDESGIMSGVAIDFDQTVLGAGEPVWQTPGPFPTYEHLRP